MSDFDRVIDRKGTYAYKWEKYRNLDVIPLWVADMDFASPPQVVSALKERIDHAVFGYTKDPEELNTTVIEYCKNSFDWAIEKQWIIWLPGLVTGINIACRSVGERNDSVITMPPIYPPFLEAPQLSKRDQVSIPLKHTQGQWIMDFDSLATVPVSKNAHFLFCNPQNPTGRVYTKEELLALSEICMDRNIIVCSDEIHCDLVLDTDKKHIPLASLNETIADRTITLMAPSKTYNIAGLGCSFAIIPNRKLRIAFQRAMKGIVPHVNLLGYTAALAAYRDSQEWLADLLSYLRINRDITEERISSLLGLSITHVEATYLAWIDARSLQKENPTRFFEEAGVGFSDGADFGAPGYVRLNFGCPRPLLEKALSRIEKAVS